MVTVVPIVSMVLALDNERVMMIPQIDDFHPWVTVLAVVMVIVGIIGTGFTSRK